MIQSEKQPLKYIHCLLLDRKFSIHCTNLPLTPYSYYVPITLVIDLVGVASSYIELYRKCFAGQVKQHPLDDPIPIQQSSSPQPIDKFGNT